MAVWEWKVDFQVVGLEKLIILINSGMSLHCVVNGTD